MWAGLRRVRLQLACHSLELGAEAETGFSWNVVAEGTLKLYESIHLTAADAWCRRWTALRRADGLLILLVWILQYACHSTHQRPESCDAQIFRRNYRRYLPDWPHCCDSSLDADFLGFHPARCFAECSGISQQRRFPAKPGYRRPQNVSCAIGSFYRQADTVFAMQK